QTVAVNKRYIDPTLNREAILAELNADTTNHQLLTLRERQVLKDMGSLKAIHRHFDRALSTPVTIINNVSTSMALYVGERILQGH
ncbi:hypothetical protein ONK27_27305, partial [Salmonella enterica subsp. enterica serovar Virginia]|nr:hypothetical protein [Salmonella enterica subsp. enterica serovar Virginia]